MKHLLVVLFLLADLSGIGQLTKTKKPGVKYDSIAVERFTYPPAYEWEYWPVDTLLSKFRSDDFYTPIHTPDTTHYTFSTVLQWPERPHKYDTVNVHGYQLILDTAINGAYGLDGLGILIFWQQKQIDSLSRRLDSLIGELKAWPFHLRTDTGGVRYLWNPSTSMFQADSIIR